MLHQIKSWISGKVLFEADTDSLKACVELAVSKKVSLNYAQLNGAQLNGAQLNYAQLNGAQLNYAQLNYAQLNYAQLNDAQLNDAQLNDAKLNDAKLNDAKLNDAQLNYAQLNYAKLNDAQLIRIDGLKFSVIISPTHVHVGCKRFKRNEFRDLDLDSLSQYGEAIKQYPIVIAMLDALDKHSKNNKDKAA